MKIYTDGASRGNPGPAAGGIVVGDHKFGLCFGIATNNVAEYRALLFALYDAKVQKAEVIEIFSDSLLMVNQINSHWLTKNSVLDEYRKDVLHFLAHNFKTWAITHIPRGENVEADRLANEALDMECEK